MPLQELQRFVIILVLYGFVYYLFYYSILFTVGTIGTIGAIGTIDTIGTTIGTTWWMLLPKKYCFISFFMKIFVAMAERLITGTMIVCIQRINHAG